MKWILLILSIFGLFSCNNMTGRKSNETTRTHKSSLVCIDSFSIDQNGVTDNKYNEFYSCQFEKFINDPKTPKLAKDIYLDNEWNLSNDNETLALLDSLTAEDITSRPFYFKVVTKSYKKSDGYYAEGLGLAGFEFVEKHTQDFATYFDNKKCHTDSDLFIWTDIVILEFGIRVENSHDKPTVDDYIKILKMNCKNCSTTQKETINKFGSILKEKWKDFLKHID